MNNKILLSIIFI